MICPCAFTDRVGMSAVPPKLPGVREPTVAIETVAAVEVEETAIPVPAITEDKVPEELQASCPVV
jgi:hypothetical protein